jgi:hypothetical protein
MIDLCGATVEEVVELVFDHPPKAEGEQEWYWRDEFDEMCIPPVTAVAVMRWICAHPDEIASRYSGPQIEQAFWFMFSAGGSDLFREQLWNAELPWSDRAACISELGTLHESFFPRVEVMGVSFMLWDLISFGYDCGNRVREASEEDRRVQEAIFATLSRLLRSDDPDAQQAALHGLGHLRHPRGNARISAFLEQRRRVEAEVREYAGRILAGHVL